MDSLSITVLSAPWKATKTRDSTIASIKGIFLYSSLLFNSFIPTELEHLAKTGQLAIDVEDHSNEDYEIKTNWKGAVHTYFMKTIQ